MGDGRYFRMGLLAAILAAQGACVGQDDACGGSTSDFPYCGDDEGPVNDSPGEGDGVTGGGGSPPPGAEPGGNSDAGSAADPDDSAADGGVDADGGPDAASEPAQIKCDGVWTMSGVVGAWTCRRATGE